ncbi:MAG: hypothetical protein LQ340_001594 [Diploschistes diacapsis]|nr:MAG: hypothetical protein LQ340_001594 [Diploschistes diacapsis]
MPEAQLPNPRKRRNSERLTPQHNGTLQYASKRQKHGHPDGSQIPPAFWDNLSKIDLTKRALEELDRRNTQATPNSRPAYSRPHRPVTRRVLAELKKSCRPLIPAVEYIHDCGAKDLKDIKQTTRHGGLDLSDLRGFPESSNPLNPAMSSRTNFRVSKQKSRSASNNRPFTNTSKSTGPYNRNFQQNLVDGSVFPHAYRHPDGRIPAKPNNWEEINRRLSQPRPSLSPSKFSEERHAEFVQADADAMKEKQVTTSVIPIIEGDIGDAKCCSGGIPFTNLDHLTDGTLVPGNPDIYYGARPEQLDRRVRDKLSGHIIPSTQDDLPLAPNFFVAAKGPDGSAAVAKRQACYDGALGARGIHSLQSYGQEDPSHDNNTYTISVTYHDGTLKMYTSHLTQPASSRDRPEYFMHQVKGWSMTSDFETFLKGTTYYRNGRDWAKEQRDEAIRRANERIDEHHVGTLAIDAGIIPTSSFVSEATLDGISTVEALSQESRIPQTKDSNITTHHEPETSSTKLSLEQRTPVKRSNKQPRRSPRSRRK